MSVDLISKQAQSWPPFTKWAQNGSGDPYLTTSLVLYVLAAAGLAIDLLPSLLWSGFLCATAALNHKKHPGIWFSHVQKFPWLSDQASASGIPRPRWRQLILGAPSERPATKSIPDGVTSWLLNSTMFRRSGTEPLSHGLLRGGLALILWAILVACGILYCVINPIRQFSLLQGLPKRLLTQDSHPKSTFGHISGFIVGVNGRRRRWEAN